MQIHFKSLPRKDKRTNSTVHKVAMDSELKHHLKTLIGTEVRRNPTSIENPWYEVRKVGSKYQHKQVTPPIINKDRSTIHFSDKGRSTVHFHSEVSREAPRTYVEAVSTGHPNSQRQQPRTPPTPRKASYPQKSPKTIFTYNLPENYSAKDIWSFYKRKGDIRDVILPKQKDKYNKRYGFVIPSDMNNGLSLLNNKNGAKLRGHTLKAKWAKQKEDSNLEGRKMEKNGRIKETDTKYARFPYNNTKLKEAVILDDSKANQITELSE